MVPCSIDNVKRTLGRCILLIFFNLGGGGLKMISSPYCAVSEPKFINITNGSLDGMQIDVIR